MILGKFLWDCVIIMSRHRDRAISMIVLHVSRDSEHEAGGWVVQERQCQRDSMNEQSL